MLQLSMPMCELTHAEMLLIVLADLLDLRFTLVVLLRRQGQRV